MKNLRTNKLFIVLLIAVMMLTISTKVFATDTLVDPTQGSLQIEITKDEPSTSTQTPPTTQTPTTTPDTKTTTETKLPQTGDASDYAIFALIAVCVVVAIVAYKKVREYNKI